MPTYESRSRQGRRSASGTLPRGAAALAVIAAALLAPSWVRAQEELPRAPAGSVSVEAEPLPGEPPAAIWVAPRPSDEPPASTDLRLCRGEGGLRCQIRTYEERLRLIDLEIAGRAHPDDTVGIVLIGVGVPLAIGGGIGALFIAGLRAGRDDGLLALSLFGAAVGAVTALIAGVWIAINGNLWRVQDNYRDLIRDLRTRLTSIGVDVSQHGASLSWQLVL